MFQQITLHKQKPTAEELQSECELGHITVPLTIQLIIELIVDFFVKTNDISL